ncbi:MAG TPA: hypothetical protein VH280_21725 [Verrucomicrobiae bacterium]|jgi:hypothetical protein|nr:hypothetical protein [Verrucomicrobiae bacterium]
MRYKPRPTRPSLLRGALVLSFLSPGVFIAKGQDALFNSIGVQNAINSPAFVPAPDQPHLGPVLYNLGAYSSLTFNDNINGSQTNAESDVLLQTGINLGLEWPATEHSDLRLNTGFGYLHYFRFTSNSGLTVTPGSALSYALSWNDASVTFYNQASYTRQVTAEAAVANVATQPQFGNTAGLLGEWDPGHFTFQTSYSHAINLSDSAHDYLNNSLEQFFGRAGWRFAAKTQAGAEASGSLTSYQVASQSNNSSYSIGAYLEWQVTPWLQITARGGPTYYEFYSQSPGVANSSLNSYYVSFSVNNQLTDFLSQNLSLVRSIQLGANQGSSYVQQLTASYSLNWALTRRINLSASLNYDDGQQPFVLGYFDFFGFVVPDQVTENYQLYSGDLSASWQFTDHLEATLGYSHSQRNSNLSGRAYSADSVTAQLNYRF